MPKGPSQTMERIVKLGGVAAMSRVLVEGSIEDQCWVVGLLVQIAQTGLTGQEAASDHWAAAKPVAEAMVNAGAVPTLVKLADCDISDLADMCHLLLTMLTRAGYTTQVVQAGGAAGMVRRLPLQSIRSWDDHVAAQTLGLLAAAGHTQQMLAAGLLPAVEHILSSVHQAAPIKQTVDTVAHTARLLTFIAHNHPDDCPPGVAMPAIVGALAAMVMQAKEGSPMRFYALEALANTLPHMHQLQVHLLLTRGVPGFAAEQLGSSSSSSSSAAELHAPAACFLANLFTRMRNILGAAAAYSLVSELGLPSKLVAVAGSAKQVHVQVGALDALRILLTTVKEDGRCGQGSSSVQEAAAEVAVAAAAGAGAAAAGAAAAESAASQAFAATAPPAAEAMGAATAAVGAAAGAAAGVGGGAGAAAGGPTQPAATAAARGKVDAAVTAAALAAVQALQAAGVVSLVARLLRSSSTRSATREQAAQVAQQLAWHHGLCAEALQQGVVDHLLAVLACSSSKEAVKAAAVRALGSFWSEAGLWQQSGGVADDGAQLGKAEAGKSAGVLLQAMLAAKAGQAWVETAVLALDVVVRAGVQDSGVSDAAVAGVAQLGVLLQLPAGQRSSRAAELQQLADGVLRSFGCAGATKAASGAKAPSVAAMASAASAGPGQHSGSSSSGQGRARAAALAAGAGAGAAAMHAGAGARHASGRSSSGGGAGGSEVARCGQCGATAGEGCKLQCCAACKQEWYCGAMCQRMHWPAHKAACKAARGK